MEVDVLLKRSEIAMPRHEFRTSSNIDLVTKFNSGDPFLVTIKEFPCTDQIGCRDNQEF